MTASRKTTWRICGGDLRSGTRDACPDELHDYPLPDGYVDASEAADRRIARGWSNKRCVRCGLYGWQPGRPTGDPCDKRVPANEAETITRRTAMTDLTAVPWRTGRHLGRTVYARTGGDDWKADTVIGMMDTPELAEAACAAHNAGLRDAESGPGEEMSMSESDAAARTAGTEVEVRCSLVFGDEAILELPGEDEAVRWPAAEVAAELGVAVGDLPAMRFRVTVRESAESGRVLSGFRAAEG